MSKARGESAIWLVTVWDERKALVSGSLFETRKAEFMFDSYATARSFAKEARRLLEFTPEETNARYPCAGIDIQKVPLYTTVKRAREQSWPFEELKES